MNSTKSQINVIEVNNVDAPGEAFNGYSIMEKLNKCSNFNVHQLVTTKNTNNPNVINLFNENDNNIEAQILKLQKKLSIQNCFSLSTEKLIHSKYFKQADIVHFHLIHNFNLSLYSLIEIANQKRTLISIHDPWMFTGRCVHYYNCNKYLTGCKNCQKLSTMFPMKEDNCNEMWKLKKNIYSLLNVEFIVSSKYMLDLFKKSPLTKYKKVHYIPFGVNINFYKDDIDKIKLKKYFGIEEDSLVIFHRSQNAFKGTKYLIEALNKLTINKKITILTCDSKNMLQNLNDKYTVIELGIISKEEMKKCYIVCDIFLMPSIGESFGMMAIEAMSCSRPVIVFDNTALPSVTFAPKCGLVAKNLDSNDLMQKISYLLSNESERIHRGELGRKLVEKHYNEDTYNKKIVNLYKKIINEKNTDIKIKKKKLHKDNKSIISLKVELNKLTNKLIKKNTGSYKKMKFQINRKHVCNNKKINYSNMEVQRFINSYNNKLYDAVLKKEIKESLHIIFLIKRFFYLIKNDRRRLIRKIKQKIGGNN